MGVFPALLIHYYYGSIVSARLCKIGICWRRADGVHRYECRSFQPRVSVVKSQILLFTVISGKVNHSKKMTIGVSFCTSAKMQVCWWHYAFKVDFCKAIKFFDHIHDKNKLQSWRVNSLESSWTVNAEAEKSLFLIAMNIIGYAGICRERYVSNLQLAKMCVKMQSRVIMQIILLQFQLKMSIFELLANRRFDQKV